MSSQSALNLQFIKFADPWESGYLKDMEIFVFTSYATAQMGHQLDGELRKLSDPAPI